jgi:hypothetical protein
MFGVCLFEIFFGGVKGIMGAAEGNPGKQRFRAVILPDIFRCLPPHPRIRMPLGRPREREHFLILLVPDSLSVCR